MSDQQAVMPGDAPWRGEKVLISLTKAEDRPDQYTGKLLGIHPHGVSIDLDTGDSMLFPWQCVRNVWLQRKKKKR